MFFLLVFLFIISPSIYSRGTYLIAALSDLIRTQVFESEMAHAAFSAPFDTCYQDDTATADALYIMF